MKSVKQIVSRFHADERGSNSLEQIVIFAFGVLILGGAYYMWNSMEIGGESGGLLSKVGSVIDDILNIRFN